MEYDPEIVVDELTKNLPGLLGGIMTKPYTIVIPIYEQVTSMSGDGIKVFSTVQPWFKCFFPQGQGLKHYIFCRSTCFTHLYTMEKRIHMPCNTSTWVEDHPFVYDLLFFFPIVRFNYDW